MAKFVVEFTRKVEITVEATDGDLVDAAARKLLDKVEMLNPGPWEHMTFRLADDASAAYVLDQGELRHA